MSRTRDTMSPDLEAADADIISSEVSSRPKEVEKEEEEDVGGRRRVIRLIATIVGEVVVVVWWAGLNG